MTILDSDIKLLKSERLTDAPEGGGRITAAQVIDGQSNNLFADVSDLDRTVGRVSLRKAYVAVVSLNTDMYLGAHAIIDDAPDDPNVSAVLFTTKSWTDLRADARDHLERYVVRGPAYQGFLYETQIVGARAIVIFQSIQADPPAVGDVLSLVQLPGQAGEVEQFVRLTAVSYEDRTFTDQAGNFQRRIVTCETSDALRATFVGHQISRYDTITPTARVFSTMVADAARYYGIAPLTDAAAPMDLSVQVNHITAQLVPSARGETPLVDALAGGDSPALVPAGPPLTRSFAGKQLGGTVAFFIGGASMPGSVSLSVGGTTWADSGRGVLIRSGVEDATIDYTTGAVRFASAVGPLTGTVQAVFTPAANLARVRNTGSLPVTLATRGYNYAATLSPIAAPGNLVVDYLSGGRWYRLRDQGNGTLAGASSAIGAGTVNYATGTVLVTLGALPDVGSEVMFGWSAGPETIMRAGDATIQPPDVEVQLALADGESVVPGSVVITWTSGGARSATANAGGVIGGDATGRVVHATGALRFRPNALPAFNTTYRIEFSRSTRVTVPISATPVGGGVLTFTLPTAPVRAGSVHITGVVPGDPGTNPIPVSVRDDGLGALIGDCGAGSVINYGTGQCSMVATKTVLKQTQVLVYGLFG